MSQCPRCGQTVDKTAINCPNCKNLLKAFGHPGIPLHQAVKDEFLCDRCIYHQDDSCNYPQRPYAKSCILFRDIDVDLEEDKQPIYSLSLKSKIFSWCRTNQVLLIIVFLLVISIALTIFT